ncbi:MAG: M15 family metallopeptidase [Muribaculaceae bacterium]|nr:M15 family metallopeptidase [Muribaculaceae bacterium]
MKPILQHIKRWTSRDNRWLALPCTAAALFVLLVMVKSCQGIAYNFTNECRIYKLGYPIEEARILAAELSDAQVDSLIARQEHDTIAIPVIHARYYIADNFDRYLAYHKKDTTGAPLDNIIALVNVGYDRDRESSAVPCDTSKGQLMLVNGRHYLDENYKPDTLVTFSMDYCYWEQKARPVVVDAFLAMQKACKEQTDAQLMVNSAYRSYQEQIGTHKRNPKGYAARAGSSEHQTGFALDITSREHPMRWPFDKSVEGVWMREHCHEFGFILRYPEKQSHIFGFAYEPWHLRYVGKEVAKRIHDEDITFDEYYAFYLDKK